uniref:hypothetical protein n=1 Tax=Salmonella enterica TaxID=28901 RepID=UPI001C3E4D2A
EKITTALRGIYMGRHFTGLIDSSQQNGYVWKYRNKNDLTVSFELTSSGELQATSFRVRRLEAWGQADE